MTRYFLKQLSVEGFRGINNQGDPLVLKFKPGCVNSIHAPNGVGKSSIFDALQYAIFGYLPRLRELQEAEQGDTYLINRFHPTSTATIELVLESDDGTPDVSITVLRGANGLRSVTSPTGFQYPESLLKSLQEDFVLVDYSRFIEFIDSSALNRGRSFSSLVGLSAYSAMRQCLEGAKDTRSLNSDFGITTLDSEISNDERSQTVRLTRVIDAFNEVTGERRERFESIEELVATATNALRQIAPIEELLDSVNVLQLDYEQAEKKIETAERGQDQLKLSQYRLAQSNLEQLIINEEDLSELATIVGNAQVRDEAVKQVGGASLLSLLKDASELIETSSWPFDNKCPVCQLPQTTSLKERLHKQISIYDYASQLDKDLIQEIKAANSLRKLGSLEVSAELAIPREEQLSSQIQLGVQQNSVSTENLALAHKRLTELEAKRVERVQELGGEIASLEASLPPSLVAVTKVVSAAKKFRDELSAYINAVAPLSAKKAQYEKLIRWKKFISDAAKLFSTAETKLTNERISEIQTGYQDLFSNLVRGGPDVRPTLDRALSTEQIDLKLADFHGLHGLSARALLSESYRNAVAASIFLTAAIKFRRVPRFMVLDDVTSSFDGGHQFALMEALRLRLQQPANVDGIQFIVLSHDTALEKYFDKLNGSPDWHHQKLQGMAPKGRLMVNAQEGDRLRIQAQSHLQAGQIDIGAPLVRQYMEFKLSQIISRLQILVPPDYATRADKRTLSTYIDAISNAVELYKRAGMCVLTAQQINDISNTHVPSLVANFVSHYETGAGSPFSAYPLLGVLASIDDLSDCFTYMDTGSGTSPVKRFYKRLDKR